MELLRYKTSWTTAMCIRRRKRSGQGIHVDDCPLDIYSSTSRRCCDKGGESIYNTRYADLGRRYLYIGRATADFLDLTLRARSRASKRKGGTVARYVLLLPPYPCSWPRQASRSSIAVHPLRLL